MNAWLGDDRDDFIQRCRQDIEEVYESFFLLYEEREAEPPSAWVENLLEDVCLFRVFDRPLPDSQLAMCDFQNRIVMINSEMDRFVEQDLILNLRRSTLAHELGHIRLHHDEVTERTFISSLGGLKSDDPRSFQKELEANLYAAMFLLPERRLRRIPAAKRLLNARRMGRDMRSSTIWKTIYQVAHSFKVSVSMVKRRLQDLKWIEETGEEVANLPVLRLR